MQTGLHRNTISKVYRQLETDGVVEAMADPIYVRDQQKPREIRTPPSATAASPTLTAKAQMRRRSAQRRLRCSRPARC